MYVISAGKVTLSAGSDMDYLILVGDSKQSTLQAQDILIQGFKFDGSNGNTDDGIRINSSDEVVVEDCHFTDIPRQGISAGVWSTDQRKSNNLTIQKSTFEDSGMGLAGHNNLLVENCDFKGVPSNKNTLIDFCFGEQGTAGEMKDSWLHNITIHDITSVPSNWNNIIGGFEYVKGGGFDSVTVRDTDSVDSGWIINTRTDTDTYLRDFEFRDVRGFSVYNGIYIADGDNVTINGAVIKGTASGSGININAGEDIVLSNCYLEKCYNSGILFSGDTGRIENCTVKNNMQSGGWSGIRTKQGTRLRIDDTHAYDDQATTTQTRSLRNWGSGGPAYVTNSYFDESVIDNDGTLHMEKNAGYITENSGNEADAVAIDTAGRQTITVLHGLDETPPVQGIDAWITNEGATDWEGYITNIKNVDADSFDVVVYVATASATSGATADLSWEAKTHS